MLPVAAHPSHKDSLSSIAELSEFSFTPPDEEERRDWQTVDAYVGYPGRSESFNRHGINIANQKSQSNLQSVDQGSHAIYKEAPHSIKKYDIMKRQPSYATRQDLLKRLEQGSSKEGLGGELKVMINMMERMNTLLLGLGGTAIFGAPKISMNAGTINQGMALAAQMKHYFNTLGKKFECQIHNITKIQRYLPILGPHVESTLVRTALKIWNERFIITYVDSSYHLFLTLALETIPPKRDSNKRKLNPEMQSKLHCSSST